MSDPVQRDPGHPVLPIMELPIARLGDACKSPSGKSGTITTASNDFFVDGRGVARVGDTVTYADGSATTCLQGDPFVSDGSRPIVRKGFVLADGGRVVQGSHRATSGSPTPGAGSIAEHTLVAARANTHAFVPTHCEVAAVAAMLAREAGGTRPATPAGVPPVSIHADLGDGGDPRLHMMPDEDGAAECAS